MRRAFALDKFKITVLKALKQIIKNQENPSFMDKDKLMEIMRDINQQLDKEKGHHEPKSRNISNP